MSKSCEVFYKSANSRQLGLSNQHRQHRRKNKGENKIKKQKGDDILSILINLSSEESWMGIGL